MGVTVRRVAATETRLTRVVVQRPFTVPAVLPARLHLLAKYPRSFERTSRRRTFAFGCSLFHATSIVRTFPEHVEDRKMFLDASDPLPFPRRVNIEFRPTKRDLSKRRRDDGNVSRAARMPRVRHDDSRGILEHVSLLIDPWD